MVNIRKPFKASLYIFILLGLAGCGGGSGDTTPTAGTGQVSVIITDGPTDQYERILITLSRMTLIGSGGHQVVYDDDPITFDLLKLRDRADFAFSQRIAAGDYNKIRLEVTKVELVDLGDPADPADNVTVMLDDLPANGKIDLNPRGPFTIYADRVTVVELDIDALRSFQVVQTGTDSLRLRPVIFVNVYDDEIVLPNRMTRAFGTVEEIDESDSSLLLCNLQFVAQLGERSNTGPDSCVQVFAGGANHFDEEGLPFDFAALVAAIEASDAPMLTAVGLPSLPDGTVDNIVLNVDAVVTEFGPRKTDTDSGWETSAGTIVTDRTTQDCASSQCVDFLPATESSALTVQLAPETLVFTRDGTELSQDDLGTGVAGAFDGLRVDAGGTEELRASLFIRGPNAGTQIISGTLTAVSAGAEFDTLTVQPEGEAAVSVCVDSAADVLQILVDDEVITIVDLLDPLVLDPSVGLQVEAAGDPGVDAGCDLDAKIVIVE